MFCPFRLSSLRDPAARRRADLEEWERLQQFLFDVDCELQWIADKRPAATATELGQSLTDATNLHKKHLVCYPLPIASCHDSGKMFPLSLLPVASPFASQ